MGKFTKFRLGHGFHSYFDITRGCFRARRCLRPPVRWPPIQTRTTDSELGAPQFFFGGIIWDNGYISYTKHIKPQLDVDRMGLYIYNNPVTSLSTLTNSWIFPGFVSKWGPAIFMENFMMGSWGSILGVPEFEFATLVPQKNRLLQSQKWRQGPSKSGTPKSVCFKPCSTDFDIF